jgi:anti-sigma factor RsiW
MPEEAANSDLALQERLVAYLDGELDAETSRQVEELLAVDPDVRRRLQLLDRTWQLLDELDATPVGERFAQTTLEMVAVAAAAEVEQARAEAPRCRRRRALLMVGGLAAAVLAGFLATAQLVPDPNKRLLEELPVLEHLDQYSEVRDIKFLRLLHDQKIFSEEHANGP